MVLIYDEYDCVITLIILFWLLRFVFIADVLKKK